MSVGQLSRQRSQSRSSKHSANTRQTPPQPTLTPENTDREFDPCAATASFFLYAQRNRILCLHHDTLAIERRFDRHREDVLWISVDNISERGAGRLAVSYDAGQTAIVWDLFTGDEVARFASYEQIRTATWMRNGNIAFGNSQGNVILFEPSTSEHISARTIFDPITALAPATDCRTFAIGYLNGSILIATLQPSFTILHTLTTSRGPSRITGLAWHGSSSKQKSEMLATQTSDGDLRVWSIPKTPNGEAPNIIRILNRSEVREPGPCWFGWSKNGRIVQHSEGETRAWDVRTKKVTYEVVPTLDGVTAVANYGPTATLFTLGRNHTVQQYDVNPNNAPMQVASVQHVPANTPPSPPNLIEESRYKHATPATATSTMVPVLPVYMETGSSEGEGHAMSPLQKIAREMDQIEEEMRDRVAPLSPSSSRASSVSSKSSNGGRRPPGYRYDQASSRSSKVSTKDGTEFSYGSSVRTGHDSISIRSTSSMASSNYKSSNLRKEIMRSPDEANGTKAMDLFPFTKARLREVPFRTPQYGQVARTPDVLRQEMLSVVFGWNGDVEGLIRDERAFLSSTRFHTCALHTDLPLVHRHSPGAASGVLLSKWLGDLGADSMASMIGSESMTSSDWMLLALSSMGQDSQKKVGEAFVQRLLEKGDIHPAVAILLGLREHDDAVEIYTSQAFYMEALLLTCLVFPSDWQRQSHLLRKWGETSVMQGQPELAVRCFSCTSIETSEPWVSPRAQDAAYTAQTEQGLGAAIMSLPLSPPSATGSSRMTAKNASLKLITTFGDRGVPKVLSTTGEPTPVNYLGVTPIAESALSPSGAGPWLRGSARANRDPSSARTATPGAYRRKRLPSRSETARARGPSVDATPLANTRDFVRPNAPDNNSNHDAPYTTQDGMASATNSQEQSLLLSAATYQSGNTSSQPLAQPDHLPSPACGVFARLKEQSRTRNGSRERMPGGLHVQVMDTVMMRDALSPAPSTTATESGMSVASGAASRAAALSPPLTGGSVRSVKGKAMDQYISSLEEANVHARQQRGESRQRAQSRDGRSRSRLREPSEVRGRAGIRYIKPAKRSPSSPVPMSPDESYLNSTTYADERYYDVTSPVESSKARGRSRSNIPSAAPEARSGSKSMGARASPERSVAGKGASIGASRAVSRHLSQERHLGDGRGRSDDRTAGSVTRSPSSPLPMSPEAQTYQDEDETQSDGQRIRLRQRSSSRRPDDQQKDPQYELSPEHSERRAASTRRQLAEQTDEPVVSNDEDSQSQTRTPQERVPRLLSRKELAARELEERRLSLARRPSAPTIPLPGQFSSSRPTMANRSHTDLSNSPTSFLSPMSSSGDRGIQRSQTVDPDAMMRYTGRTTGTSTPSAPIGLPATPRAMRHPRYMSSDPNDYEPVPAVPDISDHLTQLAPSVFSPNEAESDQLAPLLPSTVFGQKGPQALPRSASAPPERDSAAFPSHPAYKPNLTPIHRRVSLSRHTRKISPPEAQLASKRHSPPPVTASIDQTLHESHIVIVEEQEAPPMLPELQHLAGPPPPPIPPTMFNSGHSTHDSLGVINIAIEEEAPMVVEILPAPMDRAPTGSPSVHRRGRGSVSEGIGSRIRNVTERMRSTSTSRAMSPPIASLRHQQQPPPYETVLPPALHRRDSLARAKSPLERVGSQAACRAE
ncbi:hypothetical protein LTR66_005897 [Elasticomyces elasticus]|nr:hypothetical protein LTR66_005897 [Elasticomyces elasticus]